jgi:hypothetical protein
MIFLAMLVSILELELRIWAIGYFASEVGLLDAALTI